MVDRAYQRTEKLLRDNRVQLNKVGVVSSQGGCGFITICCSQLAAVLLEREVLSHAELVDILGALPHRRKLNRYTEISDLW